MWKTLGILFVLIVIAAAGVGYYLYANLGSIVKAEIEKYGSAATGTSVKVGSVSISVATGEASLNDLSIANPEGFSDSKALSAGKIAVSIDTKSIVGSGPIVIRSVEIESPGVSYEQTLSGNNLSAIEKHVNEYARGFGGTGPSTAPEPGGKAKERKLIITDLYIRNGTVTISESALGAEKLSAGLPEIHLHNVGKSSNGATYAEVTRQVLGAVMNSASKIGAEKLLARIGPLGGAVGSGASSVKSGIGALLGGH